MFNRPNHATLLVLLVLLAAFLAAGSASGATLWDQPLSTANTSGYVNQDFTDYATYSSYLLDDFTNNAQWTIQTVFVPGDGWNGFTSMANATQLNWKIYADASGLPAGYPGGGAAPQWELSLAPGDAQVAITNGTSGYPSNVTLTLTTPINLPPGTWWLAFYPSLAFSGGGQSARQASDTTNGAVARFINPGGSFGYGTGYQNWTVLGMSQTDLAFRLEGTAGDVVGTSADLTISKTNGATETVPGAQVTYTVTAANGGPDEALDATVSDTFPAALTGCSWTCSPSAGATCNSGSGTALNDTVDLPAGMWVTYSITCSVSADATGSLVNTATVTPPAGVSDPDSADRTATDTDTLTPEADLSITKTADRTTALDGTLTYTIAVRNDGPSDATSVVVTDALPAAVTYVSSTCGGVYTAASHTWTWTIGTLTDGSSTSCDVVVEVTPDSGGTIENTAVVDSATTDPTPANDAASAAFFAPVADVPSLSGMGMAMLSLLLLIAGTVVVGRFTS